MRLTCMIVSKVIASLAPDEAPAAWVSKHINRCDCCREEAARQARLAQALRPHETDERRCALEWAAISAGFADRSAPAHSRRLPAFAAASGVVVLLVVAAIVVPFRPSPPEKPITRSEPVTRAATSRQQAAKTVLECSKPRLPGPARIARRQRPRVRTVRASVRAWRRRPAPRHSPALVYTATATEPPADGRARVAPVVDELSYKAGRAAGRALNTLAENMRPDMGTQVRKRVERWLAPVSQS